MKKVTLFILTITVLSACNSVENKLAGAWVVDQAYYYDEPVIWDLYSNGFDLHKNNTCDLPAINTRSKRTPTEKTGVWRAYKEINTTYLEINSGNWIFNRTFQVNDYRKVRDTVSWGYLIKMTLVSDSLKMDCTKVFYD